MDLRILEAEPMSIQLLGDLTVILARLAAKRNDEVAFFVLPQKVTPIIEHWPAML